MSVLAMLKPGDRVAVMAGTGEDPTRIIGIVEVWMLSEREVRTVPLGTRPESQRHVYSRWSQRTGKSTPGGNEVIRPATPREVAVWQARKAVEKATTAATSWQSRRTYAEEGVEEKRRLLADAEAHCARVTAEHADAQRKLAEAEAALAAAEAGAL